MILDNYQITIRDFVEDIGIMFGSCQAIFTNVLGMKRGAAKIVPKMLNFEQKQRHMDIAQEMLMTFNNDTDLLKKISIGDEALVFAYDIQTKAQSF